MKETIRQAIINSFDSKFEEIWNIALSIHETPEIAFQEFHSRDLQTEFLLKEGFTVTKDIGGLRTSYAAKVGSGKPVIAIFAEYDALPQLGHACGHNLIAASALGAAIICKEFLQRTKTEGTLMVYGTPAEESGGGKIMMLKNGAFEGVDAVIMQHPTSATTRLAGSCMSSNHLTFEFYGKSAQAGSHPEKGINALNAAILYITACSFLRQTMKTTTRFSEYVADGGVASNVLPGYAKVETGVRSFSLKDLNTYTNQLINAAEHCAKAMGCTVKTNKETGYLGRIPNNTLSNICRKELLSLGEPVMDGMPDDYGGEDLGNVSRRIPICNPYVTLFPDYKISGHTPQFRDLAASESGKHCVEIASKAMGLTACDLFENPLLIEDAKKELQQRLEGEENE